MNYYFGAHSCSPSGEIKYSSTIYSNKHMSYLGLPFFINKNVERYNRSHEMRKHGMAIHYNNIQTTTDTYNTVLNNSQSLPMIR